MKKTVLSILVLCVIAFGFWYFVRSEKKATAISKARGTTVETPQQTDLPVKTSVSNTLQATGTVVPAKVQDVTFAVSGKLENGEANFQKGMKFRKNQLLFQVNNRDAFLKMLDVKMDLKSRLEAIMPQISKAFPAEKEKWSNFMASLAPGSLVAEIPAYQTPEEEKLIASTGIAARHQEIKNHEAGMAGYFFIAPFDGMVLDRSASAGKQIKKGEVVAQIAKQGKLMVKCTFESSLLTEDAGIAILEREVIVGKGKVEKSLPSREKGFTDLYISVEGQKLALGESYEVVMTGGSR